MAMGNLYQATAQALALALAAQNATSQQQSLETLSQAVSARAIAYLLGSPATTRP